MSLERILAMILMMETRPKAAQKITKPPFTLGLLFKIAPQGLF